MNAQDPKDNNNTGQKSNVHLKVDSAMEQGSYSNAVSVHINQNEVVLDFGYLIPNQNPMTIKLANRINLSHRTAENLLNILSNAILDWRNKQNKSGNQPQKNE